MFYIKIQKKSFTKFVTNSDLQKIVVKQFD